MLPIIGSIVERKPTSSISRPSTSASTKTGFPPVQHRSKSAFARNREEKQSRQRITPSSRLRDVPLVVSSLNESSAKARDLTEPDDDDWRHRISKENEERVAGMDDAEREEERRQILERFGTNIGNVLKRARLAREQQRQSGRPPEPLCISQGR
jgi:hypothetical protein